MSKYVSAFGVAVGLFASVASAATHQTSEPWPFTDQSLSASSSHILNTEVDIGGGIEHHSHSDSVEYEFSVSKFPAHLGTLTAVRVDILVQFDGSYSASGPVLAGEAQFDWAVDGPLIGGFGDFSVGPIEYTPFSGDFKYNENGGTAWNQTTNVSGWTGYGQVEWDFVASVYAYHLQEEHALFANVSISGDLLANIEVTYTYTPDTWLSVPEPGSIALLVVAAGSLFGRSARRSIRPRSSNTSNGARSVELSHPSRP